MPILPDCVSLSITPLNFYMMIKQISFWAMQFELLKVTIILFSLLLSLLFRDTSLPKNEFFNLIQYFNLGAPIKKDCV